MRNYATMVEEAGIGRTAECILVQPRVGAVGVLRKLLLGEDVPVVDILIKGVVRDHRIKVFLPRGGKRRRGCSPTGSSGRR